MTHSVIKTIPTSLTRHWAVDRGSLTMPSSDVELSGGIAGMTATLTVWQAATTCEDCPHYYQHGSDYAVEQEALEHEELTGHRAVVWSSSLWPRPREEWNPAGR